jgi:hypothetical protein
VSKSHKGNNNHTVEIRSKQDNTKEWIKRAPWVHVSPYFEIDLESLEHRNIFEIDHEFNATDVTSISTS